MTDAKGFRCDVKTCGTKKKRRQAGQKENCEAPNVGQSQTNRHNHGGNPGAIRGGEGEGNSGLTQRQTMKQNGSRDYDCERSLNSDGESGGSSHAMVNRELTRSWDGTAGGGVDHWRAASRQWGFVWLVCNRSNERVGRRRGEQQGCVGAAASKQQGGWPPTMVMDCSPEGVNARLCRYSCLTYLVRVCTEALEKREIQGVIGCVEKSGAA